MKQITIAIDGFSSCGKSTMARQLASTLGYIYIDSGAMYRAVTLYALRKGYILADKTVNSEALAKEISSLSISFKRDANGGLQTYLNGECVEKEIRTMEVSSCVSPISALPFVREQLVELQRQLGQNGGIVMDGRDIGTTVFPGAELKIFVTASPEVRAQRRLEELRTKGDEKTTFESVLENVQQRDYIDQNRAVSPLRKADDAVLLDNSDLTIAQQNDMVMQWAKNAIEK